MARFLFSLILYVTIARWIYAELQILSPSLVPVIDSGVHTLSIPTHDRWEPIVNGLMREYNKLRGTRIRRSDDYPETTPFQPYGRPPRVEW